MRAVVCPGPLVVCLHRGAVSPDRARRTVAPSALCGPIPTRAAAGHTLQAQGLVDRAEQQRAAPAAIADLPPSLPAPAPALVGLYHGPCRRALLGPRALLPHRCPATIHQRLRAPQRPHEGHHRARPGAPTSGTGRGRPPFPTLRPVALWKARTCSAPTRPDGPGSPPLSCRDRAPGSRAPRAPARPLDSSRPRHAHRISDAKPSDQ